MKNKALVQKAACLLTATLTVMTAALSADAAVQIKAPAVTVQEANLTNNSTLKIGVVNFRKCVEESKKGKQETATLESMQSQMESSLQDLQKQLTDLSAKLNDPDYLDGVSPQAENELKHKYRTLGQEYQMMQQQFVQALQQANMKVVQSLAELVVAAVKEVAQNESLDIVFNEEAVFFNKPSQDKTEPVIALLDKNHDQETKALVEQQKSATTNKNTSNAPAVPLKK